MEAYQEIMLPGQNTSELADQMKSLIAYKAAEHDGTRVVMTLEIPPDALTDMNRKSVKVKETAKYRVSKAIVKKIEDAEGNLFDTATSNPYELAITGPLSKKLTYTVGQTLEEPLFNMNIEDVWGRGIRVFLTKRVAELYGLKSIPNGLLEEWHANGRKYEECMYVNGKKEGIYTSWHSNGVKSSEKIYVNGVRKGLYELWYPNGQKSYSGVFLDNIPEGLHQSWLENGSMRMECTVVNGVRDGLYEKWYENGQKEWEVMFVNGRVSGVCHSWWASGRKNNQWETGRPPEMYVIKE